MDLLQAIQKLNARMAIGSSSMRGAGSAGVVRCAQEFLGELPLRPFGTTSRANFLSQLDGATDDLKLALPKGAQRWGVARKGLNIFLRNCLYTTYLRDEYDLGRAEKFFEVPLDSITGARLVKESRGELPPWETVRGLRAKRSSAYQVLAAKLAAKEGVARVHLDALWWGQRTAEDDADPVD